MQSAANPTNIDTSPVIVLGMHKSGTTLVAETLHGSGIAMIEAGSAGGYDDGNKMERDDCRTLNKDLLDCADELSIDIIEKLDPETVDRRLRERGKEIVAALDGKGGRWGFKDPRTVMTFDFWSQLIEKPTLVGVFRDPVEVFQHYVRRPFHRWLFSRPAYPVAALRAWSLYNRELLEISNRHPDMLMIDYRDLMTGERGMERLADHLGTTLQDVRKPHLDRSAADRSWRYTLAVAAVRMLHGLDPDAIYSQLRARSGFPSREMQP